MYYKPSRHFMQRLKVLDPKLDCEFNRNSERFVITFKRVTGPPVILFPCLTEDGGFRFPDQRDFDVLGESDCERVSMRERLNESSKYMQDYRDKKTADAKDNIRHMTLDNKRQLKKAMGALIGGKNNSSFRRVEHKPRGQVFN